MRNRLLLIILSFGISLYSGPAEEGVKQLSLHERACMQTFFDEAIKWDQLAHTLFYENKPVSLIALVLKSKHQTYENIKALKGWKTLKRREHLFNHPDFIFEQNVVEFDKTFKVLHIYMINKQSLVVCLEENSEIFREILGDDFTPQSFIARLECGCPLAELIGENEALRGVLLGYGPESSLAYHTAYKDSSIGYLHPESETYQGIEIESPKGCKIYPVAFMGNPNSPEVKQIRSVFGQELEEFWQIYRSSNNRLVLILNQLCGSYQD